MMTNKNDNKVIYGVFTNTDLTEGRGTEYPLHHCRLRATAVRLAKGQGVMGTDAKVKPIQVIHIDGVDFVQLCDIHVKGGTKEDLELEERFEKLEKARLAKREALEKARKLGLSEKDIAALME